MAQCPKCKTEDAYIGFNNVECVNSKCEHYKKSSSSGGLEHLTTQHKKDIIKILRDHLLKAGWKVIESTGELKAPNIDVKIMFFDSYLILKPPTRNVFFVDVGASHTKAKEVDIVVSCRARLLNYVDSIKLFVDKG